MHIINLRELHKRAYISNDPNKIITEYLNEPLFQYFTHVTVTNINPHESSSYFFRAGDDEIKDDDLKNVVNGLYFQVGSLDKFNRNGYTDEDYVLLKKMIKAKVPFNIRDWYAPAYYPIPCKLICIGEGNLGLRIWYSTET